jgi:hypothetical protein
MSTPTRCTSVTFAHPFELNRCILPPGDYRIVTDEELIECLSFPGLSSRGDDDLRAGGTSSVDMVVIDPRDLRGAQLQDRRRINIRGKADKEP